MCRKPLSRAKPNHQQKERPVKNQSDENNFITTIGALFRVPAQLEQETTWH